MIGHGDYISAMINDMSRLSVTSSNSLRKSSPSARKRAQSLGRLGEENEADPYQYESLTQDDEDEDDVGQDPWMERARNIHSETNTPYLGMKKSITLQPNGILPKAKSTYEVSFSHLDGPLPPPPSHNFPMPSQGPYMSGELGSPQERVIWKRDFQLPRGMPPSQRPVACFYSPAMAMQQSHGDIPTVPTELRPNPPMYMPPQNSPGRPFSSYDLKVSWQRMHEMHTEGTGPFIFTHFCFYVYLEHFVQVFTYPSGVGPKKNALMNRKPWEVILKSFVLSHFS